MASPTLNAPAPRTADGKPDLSGTWRTPHSVTDFTAHFTPRRVIQVPGLAALLFESYHAFRQIHTDGRPLPVDPEPAWDGYSVGRWESDTLIVETIGINDKSWLDDRGRVIAQVEVHQVRAVSQDLPVTRTTCGCPR
jgi:hypothetical protein